MVVPALYTELASGDVGGGCRGKGSQEDDKEDDGNSEGGNGARHRH